MSTRPLEAVSLSEGLDQSFAVLISAPGDVARYADVERAVRPIIRMKTQPAALQQLDRVDDRDKPGHDGSLRILL